MPHLEPSRICAICKPSAVLKGSKPVDRLLKEKLLLIVISYAFMNIHTCNRFHMMIFLAFVFLKHQIVKQLKTHTPICHSEGYLVLLWDVSGWTDAPMSSAVGMTAVSVSPIAACGFFSCIFPTDLPHLSVCHTRPWIDVNADIMEAPNTWCCFFSSLVNIKKGVIVHTENYNGSN